jgi:hypothetical protein
VKFRLLIGREQSKNSDLKVRSLSPNLEPQLVHPRLLGEYEFLVWVPRQPEFAYPISLYS